MESECWDGEGLNKGTMTSPSTSVWEKAVLLQPLPCTQVIQFLPIYLWHTFQAAVSALELRAGESVIE